MSKKVIIATTFVIMLIACSFAPIVSEADSDVNVEGSFDETLNIAEKGTASATAINNKMGESVCSYDESQYKLTFTKSATLKFAPKDKQNLSFISYEGQICHPFKIALNDGVKVTFEISYNGTDSTVANAINVGYNGNDPKSLEISGGSIDFNLKTDRTLAVMCHNPALSFVNTTITVNGEGHDTYGIFGEKMTLDGTKMTITVKKTALSASSTTSSGSLTVKNDRGIVLKSSQPDGSVLNYDSGNFPSGKTFRVSTSMDGKDLKNYDNANGYKYASFGDEIKSSDQGFPTWAIILIVVIVVLVIAAAVYYFYFRKKNEGA